MTNKTSKNLFTLVLVGIALAIGLATVQTTTRLISRARDEGGLPPVTTPSEQTKTYAFNSGYNAFSVPLEVSLSASDLCNQLRGEATTLLGWNSADQTFRYYACDEDGKDFMLKPNVGMMVKVNTPTSWQVTGMPVAAAPELIEGENFFGLTNRDLPTRASDICQTYASYEGTLTARMVEMYDHPDWIAYDCNSGAAGPDFDIVSTGAYKLTMANPADSQ